MSWRRSVRTLATVHALAMLAVCAAPRASASSNAVVLNWTGLRDSYGVPIGDYYLSLAAIPEQVTRAGPGLGWDPASWLAWTVHAFAVLGTQWTVASMLTSEAGLFVGIIAIALVILRITVSTYWLTVIGEIARAVTTAVIQVTTGLGLLLIAIPIGVFAGAVTIRRGETGRGATMILIAMTVPALSVAVFADPVGEMYGDNGLLAFGRRLGFSVAEAATHNGQLDPGVGVGGQIDALTASLITHTVREPLQLWNFGHVVDRVGNCGAAWSAALRDDTSDSPVHAMGACGDRAAVAYAQHLDGSNVWIGMVFVAAACLVALFVVVSGWAVLRVSVKAMWTTVILLPVLWSGAIPGAPQRRAIAVVWDFFGHGVEVTVYIVYVSVIGLAIERLVSAPLPAQLGGANPFAHVLMMGAASLAALYLLRHVRAEMAGHPGGHAMLGRATDVALGMGISAAVGGAGRAGLRGVRGMARELRARRDPPPWEQLDKATENPRQVHGPPMPGWEPLLHGHNGSGEDGRSGGGPDGGRKLTRAASATPVMVSYPVPPVAEPARGGEAGDVNQSPELPENQPHEESPTTVNPIIEPGDPLQR
ncbi:hypothetical protein [Mycobacterium sp.]|uniref:hypothetical protein n=1 Tax=Mycobacterium sp. TaxID=1785 RepID=UPI0039C9EF5B